MTAPRFTVLTQRPVTIDLSRPAMLYVLNALDGCHDIIAGSPAWATEIGCELDNFRNLLHNLLERSEPKPENLDLIGA